MQACGQAVGDSPPAPLAGSGKLALSPARREVPPRGRDQSFAWIFADPTGAEVTLTCAPVRVKL